MKEIISHSEQETAGFAAELAKTVASDTVIALHGSLGAGKTVFVKGVAEHLGVEETVTSPTFVIEKIYKLPEGAPWKHLIHIDAYRLESEEELSSIGWNDIATDPNNLIISRVARSRT